MNMRAGDYIRVKGKKSDWLDKSRGITYPDYNALIVEMKQEDSPFHCTVMKSDGTMWNIYKKHIVGAVV